MSEMEALMFLQRVGTAKPSQAIGFNYLGCLAYDDVDSSDFPRKLLAYYECCVIFASLLCFGFAAELPIQPENVGKVDCQRAIDSIIHLAIFPHFLRWKMSKQKSCIDVYFFVRFSVK